MTQAYEEEDLQRYEEAKEKPEKQLDSETLLRPVHTLRYLKPAPMTGATARLADVLDIMAHDNTDAVLVVENDKVAGIFSGRDALKQRLYADADLEQPVRNHMTPDPQCLTPDDPIALALNCMVQSDYRHVPLVDINEAPIGMLRLRDVVGHLAEFFPREVINVPPHSEYNPPDRSRIGG